MIESLLSAWVMLSVGVFLGAAELMFGTKGALASAILWPLGLAIGVVGGVICGAIVLVYLVGVMLPVGLLGAIFGTRRRCACEAGGATEQVGGVS